MDALYFNAMLFSTQAEPAEDAKGVKTAVKSLVFPAQAGIQRLCPFFSKPITDFDRSNAGLPRIACKFQRRWTPACAGATRYCGSARSFAASIRSSCLPSKAKGTATFFRQRLLNAVFFHTPIQGRSTQAEHCGRALDIACGFLKRLAHELLFGFLNGDLSIDWCRSHRP